jgi:hypothetical protein
MYRGGRICAAVVRTLPSVDQMALSRIAIMTIRPSALFFTELSVYFRSDEK